MNQQEMEILVNHIVVKQDEILEAIKDSRVVDLSGLPPGIDNLKNTLDGFIEKNRNKDAEAMAKFGEKLKVQVVQSKELNALMARNCQVLDDFKTLQSQDRGLSLKKMKEWFNRNVAWFAFVVLSITFCVSIYYIEFNRNEGYYRNLPAQKLQLLDQYLLKHPHALDSLLAGTKS